MGEAELHNPGLVRFSDEHMEPTTEANNNLDSATANNDNNSKSADTNNVNNQNTNHQTCNNSNSSPEGGQSIELEEALGYLASKKTWHFLIFLAIASFDIPFAFNLMIPVFLVAPNEGPQSPCFYCLGDETVQIDPYTNTNTSLLTQSQQRYTVTSDQCYFAPGEGVDESWQNVTWRQCTKFEGRCDKPYGWTPVKEFSLYCESGKWVELANSIFYLGVLLGSFFTNSISDRFGRKWVVLGGLFVQATFGILTGVLPSFPVFVAGRFVQGLIAKAVGYVSYVMCLEFLPIKLRTFYGILYNVVWVSGYCMVGVFAYLCQDWRKLTLTLNAILILFIGHCWFLPESPQFHVASNQVEKARKVMMKGARINRMQFNYQLKPAIEADSSEAVGTRVYTPLDLVKTPRIRVYFFMVSSLWFVNNLGYYMLSLASTRWGGNVYISFCLGGIVELPAYAVAFVLAERYGRKWTLVCAEWCLAVFCFLLGYFNTYLPESHDWAVIAVGISCKFFVGITFSLLLLIGTEVFPTVVRGMAVGACTLIGDFGSVMAPSIFFLEQIYSPLPYLIVGVASALGGSSVIFIAETWHRPLPVTIQDTETLHKRPPLTPEQLKNNDFTQSPAESDTSKAHPPINHKDAQNDCKVPKTNGVEKQKPPTIIPDCKIDPGTPEEESSI
ncbi:organic cation transporter protein-like [Symsagittifera roscoffensis]|uniref:organic cation transporter protein-like n=1 Tax=Symsagittifera roscoffensis TaxID=84072 RepID=UPI00307BA67F